MKSIPNFWEWLHQMEVDAIYVEGNPDIEAYYRQEYDLTVLQKDIDELLKEAHE